ncbi:MAG: class I SAM-dependent methyltransferase [Planctomycetaceae bacterium]|nr:class I SAM-dependent methyltransferase [Planctomycetaceae bacterium]
MEHCPECGHSSTVAYWPSVNDSHFSLRQCLGCQLVFTSPWPSDEELAAAYRSEYYGPESRRFWPILERIVQAFRDQRARQIASLVPPGRALDIGCGRGWTLAALRARGWQVQGVELNAAAARHAQETLGIDVTLGGFDPQQFAPKSFDAVILWHVLEHLRSPRETLAGISRILRPGGVLALAVPNRASFQAAWTREAWFHLDLPRHLWHFSRDDLHRLCTQHGLQIAVERHASWEQNPFGLVQSLLNRVGLPHNLLYDLIRRESARGIVRPWSTHFTSSLLSLLGGTALLPASIAMLLPEQIFQRGATVEMVAIKSA